MKILTFANQKGGVGKTSIALHAAFYLHEHGQRTCFLDLDGQANGTSVLTENPASHPCASDLFQTDNKISVPVEVLPGLSLIPADKHINDVESLPLSAALDVRAHLHSLADHFDYIIIDTPPTLGRRLIGALVASDEVIAPFSASSFALAGIGDLLSTIRTVKNKFNKTLNFRGVLLNKVNTRSKKQQEAIAELKDKLKGNLFPVILAERTAVSDALDEQRPVWKKPRGQSAQTAAAEMIAAMKHIFKNIK